MTTYPDTQLRLGKQDDPFGGQPADAFGGPAWAYADAVHQETQRQVLQILWSGGLVLRVRVDSAGLPGDLVFFNDTGNAALYTLQTLPDIIGGGGAYDPDATPRFGMLAETCGVWAEQGDEALVIVSGLVPSTIHGIPAGAAGYVVMDTTTGRVGMASGAPGEITIGRINTKGMLFLYPRTATGE